MTASITDPTGADLALFWETLMADPSRIGRYMDTFPKTLHGFLAPAVAGTMRAWTLRLNGEMKGLAWLHDMNCWGGTGTAWKGLYVFPDDRGVWSVEWSRLTTEAIEQIGVHSLFTGIRISNARTLRFAEKTGYTRAGVVERFGWFEGELDDLVIWSKRPGDAPEAMRQAELRAAKYRANPPTS